MSRITAEPFSRVVAPDRPRWLWEPYLPRGVLAVLDGHPGVGKSLITLDLAARLSRGLPLPDGTPVARPHATLFLSAEDGPAATRPRAEAAGADLDFLVTLSAAGGSPLLFPAALPDLEEQVRAYSADLVVIDPLMAFLPPEAAANLDQCVRRALTPLAALAARTDCTILLVRHLRKADAPRAVLRGQGSMGIIAAARTALLAATHPLDPAGGVLAVSKANAAGVAPALGYRVTADAIGRAVLDWTGPADLSADALGLRSEGPLRPRDRASAWLLGELAAGPRLAAELLAAAAGAGIPEKTLQRAKADSGVRSHCAAVKGGSAWYWYDRGAPWPADVPFEEPFELDPL